MAKKTNNEKVEVKEPKNPNQEMLDLCRAILDNKKTKIDHNLSVYIVSLGDKQIFSITKDVDTEVIRLSVNGGKYVFLSNEGWMPETASTAGLDELYTVVENKFLTNVQQVKLVAANKYLRSVMSEKGSR